MSPHRNKPELGELRSPRTLIYSHFHWRANASHNDLVAMSIQFPQLFCPSLVIWLSFIFLKFRNNFTVLLIFKLLSTVSPVSQNSLLSKRVVGISRQRSLSLPNMVAHRTHLLLWLWVWGSAQNLRPTSWRIGWQKIEYKKDLNGNRSVLNTTERYA